METSNIIALASYKTQQVLPVKYQQAMVVLHPRTRPEERQAQFISDIVTISAKARELYAASKLAEESMEGESVGTT